MKNLKKYTALILSVMTAIAIFAGCGSEEKPDTTAAVDKASLSKDVQQIVDRGVLKVGVKNITKGFGYEDPATGEYSGLEISLAKELGKYLGVDVEFTDYL